jgi:CRISPR-associated endonuclease Cas1
MLKQPASSHSLQDDFEWAERAEYWRTSKPAGRRGPPKKFKYREPLILCGHGVRLRVDRGTLLIRNGFTHYPQKAEEHRYFPGDANLPDRIVMLDGSGGVSFDALAWMSEQKITLVQLDWRGCAQIVVGINGYAAKPEMVEAQRAIQGTKCQFDLARWLIVAKLEASISTLRNSIPKSEIRENSISRIENRISELGCGRNSISISRLLGIEGDCAAAYFRPWPGLPIAWTGTRRKPIPANWFETAPRMMGWRKSAQSARHPLNSMLNYGYGMLANQTRTEIVVAGLDPTIGIINRHVRNPIPLVYDLMEPLRPLVDRHILQFAFAHTFAAGDFTINQNGGCRLNPQMAKAVVKEMPAFQEARQIVDQLIRNCERRFHCKRRSDMRRYR